VSEIFILIPGDPFGKQSVRVAKRGKHAVKYMPQETRDYEGKCTFEAMLTVRNGDFHFCGPIPPMRGPVEMNVQMFYPIPESWSKKKKEMARLGQIVPDKKPDSSNVLKSVEDGFTRVVWVDDCQVVDHHITKRFSDSPCVIAIVKKLDLGSCRP
jgi:Holliday junction resolvase RusA-like endonuclease